MARGALGSTDLEGRTCCEDHVIKGLEQVADVLILRREPPDVGHDPIPNLTYTLVELTVEMVL